MSLPEDDATGTPTVADDLPAVDEAARRAAAPRRTARRVLVVATPILALVLAALWLQSSRTTAPQLSRATTFQIERMESADRERWEPADAVLKAMRLAGTETLVDVGAGSGYLTVRFARALPKGRVVANEVNPELVEYLRYRVGKEGLPNVAVAQIAPDDPTIPPNADVVYLGNVLHLVQGRVAWLRKAHAQLAPGARLVVVQFDEARPLQGVPPEFMAPKERLTARVREAGFVLREDLSDGLPHAMLLVFERP
jgi:SAM-dependent methyltransferase